MELAIEARSVLRLLLLTLVMLHSRFAAGQAPGSDDTFVDDEDLNSIIGEGKTSVSFVVDMKSEVKLNDGCYNEELKESIKTAVRTKLISALGDDCKCQPSENVIDQDKIECMADPIVRYTGQISDWSSPESKYTVEQLSEFISSWTAEIEVDVNQFIKFTFSVTKSQSTIEEHGSGDGEPGPGVVNEEFGSGDIITIDGVIPGDGEKEEDTKGVANVGGLESGELRLQVAGYITALSIALAVLLNFA